MASKVEKFVRQAGADGVVRGDVGAARLNGWRVVDIQCPDTGKPVEAIKVGRRGDGLETLYRMGRIGVGPYRAGLRVRNAFEVLDRPAIASIDCSRMAVDGGQAGYTMPQAVLLAGEVIRDARALGPLIYPALYLVVVCGKSVREATQVHLGEVRKAGKQDELAFGRKVIEALDYLAEQWGL